MLRDELLQHANEMLRWKTGSRLKWNKRDGDYLIWDDDGSKPLSVATIKILYDVSPWNGETHEQAKARSFVSIHCSALIDAFLKDPWWGGYLCLDRCSQDSCGRWFFANDDRQIYCSPSCRPSRQPAARSGRRHRHVVRRRKGVAT